jgi:hypothetical protein
MRRGALEARADTPDAHQPVFIKPHARIARERPGITARAIFERQLVSGEIPLICEHSIHPFPKHRRVKPVNNLSIEFRVSRFRRRTPLSGAFPTGTTPFRRVKTFFSGKPLIAHRPSEFTAALNADPLFVREQRAHKGRSPSIRHNQPHRPTGARGLRRLRVYRSRRRGEIKNRGVCADRCEVFNHHIECHQSMQASFSPEAITRFESPAASRNILGPTD